MQYANVNHAARTKTVQSQLCLVPYSFDTPFLELGKTLEVFC